MKKIVTIASILMFSGTAFPQQDVERKTCIEFNERVSFYEVNPRNELMKDTLYHTRSGFKIYPDYDVVRIGNEDYVICTYPPFNDGTQRTDETVIEKNSNQDNKNQVKLEEQLPVNVEFMNIKDGKIEAINGLRIAIRKSEFDLAKKTTYYAIKFNKIKNYTLSSGLMTIPFKLRPKIDTTPFTLTTDVTLGAYLGISKRLSPYRRYYITIPVTLGLSYINIKDNNTYHESQESIDAVVPGVTWSTGIIFQISDFNLGFVLGADYASGTGSNWIYNKKIWYSFAIGYNFLSQK